MAKTLPNPKAAALPLNYALSKKTVRILGASQAGSTYVLNFFNREITLAPGAFKASDGRAITPAVCELLTAYIINYPETLPNASVKPVTFREFSNAAPLFSHFTANTAKTVETHFSGRAEALALRCRDLGAVIRQSGSYDICAVFKALPKIPVFLNFNDRDEIMPPSASFLYENTAIHYLSLKHLMTIATYLTGRLIG